MLPKFLLPKAIEPPSNIIQPKFNDVKVECCNCYKFISIDKSYIVLIDGEDRFKPVCHHCSNIRGLGKIAYMESYPTYSKRQKVGFFEDWKAKGL